MVPVCISIYNCICLYIRLPSKSVHKRLLTSARLSANVLSCCKVLVCCPHVYFMSTSCLLHVYFMPSKLYLHLLLPVRLLPGSNIIVIAVIKVCIRYGKCFLYMMCAMSCRMLSTQRSSRPQQDFPYCKTQLFFNRQA